MKDFCERNGIKFNDKNDFSEYVVIIDKDGEVDISRHDDYYEAEAHINELDFMSDSYLKNMGCVCYFKLHRDENGYIVKDSYRII